MKVEVFNRTEFQQFIDLKGLGNPKDIVSVAPKHKLIVEIPNEKRFIDLAKQFKNKLLFRKI